MSAAHDTKLEIDGDTYWVRREFELMRRLEQAFGPLAELEQRLRRCALSGEELVRLYGIALQAQASRPPVDLVEAHVMAAGVAQCSDELAMLVLHLFAGHKRTVAWLEDEAKREAAAKQEAGESAPENPPAAVSSPGTTTSKPRRRSAGRPASSGPPPSTT
jgi:hypothetical protein